MVEEMAGSKPWYASKTIWTGVAGMAYAAYAYGAQAFGWPPIPEFVVAILGALGITFRSMASKEVTGK